MFLTLTTQLNEVFLSSTYQRWSDQISSSALRRGRIVFFFSNGTTEDKHRDETKEEKKHLSFSHSRRICPREEEPTGWRSWARKRERGREKKSEWESLLPVKFIRLSQCSASWLIFFPFLLIRIEFFFVFLCWFRPRSFPWLPRSSDMNVFYRLSYRNRWMFNLLLMISSNDKKHFSLLDVVVRVRRDLDEFDWSFASSSSPSSSFWHVVPRSTRDERRERGRKDWICQLINEWRSER